MTSRMAALGPQPAAPLVPYLICEEPTAEGLIKLLGRRAAGNGHLQRGGWTVCGRARHARRNAIAHCRDAERSVGRNAGQAHQSWRRTSAAIRQAGLYALDDAARCQRRLLADGGLLDQGFLSRLLPCAPVSNIGHRSIRPASGQSIADIQRFNHRLADLLRRPPALAAGSRNELQPHPLSFDPTASRLWIDFANTIERQQLPGRELSILTGFASKLAEHGSRIDGEHMASGIEIAQWFAGEALRLFGAAAVDGELHDAQLLLAWLTEHWQEPIVSVPDLAHQGPNCLRTTEKARRLTGILVRHGWLIPMPDGAVIKGKRRREAFRIVRGTA